MPLNTVPKGQSANSNTPSKVVSKPSVQLTHQKASSARVDALKARLAQQPQAPVAQPIARRPAATSARREEISKLQRFASPPPQSPPRQAAPQRLQDIEPPPSGLAQGAAVPPVDNNIEAPQTSTAAISESLSPQAEALARKEIQLRKAQLRFKAEQDAWKQEQAKYLPKERLSTDTLKVLAEAGITPDKLVELQVNQAASQDPNQVLLNRIAELEGQIKGIIDPETGTLAQRDKAAYDQVIKQIGSDAKLLVDSDPRFGTIKSEGQTSEIVKLINLVFDEEGTVLDVEEAAEIIEAKLVDRLTKQYERISKLDKFKAKFGQPAENPAEVVPAQRQPALRQHTTLTNQGASQKPLSPRDRAVLAVQAARGATIR